MITIFELLIRNNNLHSQIKSGHQTIGMRILTVYFSLEGCQAYTKKSGSKEIKGIKINLDITRAVIG